MSDLGAGLGELDRIRLLAETDKDAAIRMLVKGLMRGNLTEMKLGYIAENAALAAGDMLGQSQQSVHEALTPLSREQLVRTMSYLHEEHGLDGPDLIRVVERPWHYWTAYAEACVYDLPNANPSLHGPEVTS